MDSATYHWMKAKEQAPYEKQYRFCLTMLLRHIITKALHLWPRINLKTHWNNWTDPWNKTKRPSPFILPGTCLFQNEKYSRQKKCGQKHCHLSQMTQHCKMLWKMLLIINWSSWAIAKIKWGNHKLIKMKKYIFLLLLFCSNKKGEETNN